MSRINEITTRYGNGLSAVTRIAIFTIIVGVFQVFHLQANPIALPSMQLASNFAVGFNVYGMVHFNYVDTYPQMVANAQDVTLKEIQGMGGKVARVFVANSLITDEEAARRLDVLLTKAETYGVQLIVALVDSHLDPKRAPVLYGNFPSGTDSYYTYIGQSSCCLLANNDFYNSPQYRTRYLKFIQTVINANKHHPNIYAWEPGNELEIGDYRTKDVVINFLNFALAAVKAADPTRLVSTGMIGATYRGFSFGDLSNFDIITLHAYNGDRRGTVDADWAKAHGKKFIVEEIGYVALNNTINRRAQLTAEIEFWRQYGASAVLQWALIPRNMQCCGGDNRFGMDTVWHGDYDDLFAMFKTIALQSAVPTITPTPALTPTPIIVPTATPPTGTVLSLSFDRQTANLGDTVNVAVQALNLINVYGVELHCSANQSNLRFLGTTNGTLFTAASDLVIQNNLGADGSLGYAVTRLRPSDPINGNGQLVNMRYQVASSNPTTVSCTAIAVDRDGRDLPLTVVNAGFNGAAPAANVTSPIVTSSTTSVPLTVSAVIPANSTISGIIRIQGRTNNAGVSVRLLTDTGNVVQESTSLNGGDYRFDNVQSGVYKIQLSCLYCLTLTRSLTFGASSTPLFVGDDQLLFGDFNINHTIDLADITLVGTNMGLNVPPAPTDVDLNGDQVIDIRDLSVVGANFGLSDSELSAK